MLCVTWGPAGVPVMLWCHLGPCWCHRDAVVSFGALLVSQRCCGVIWGPAGVTVMLWCHFGPCWCPSGAVVSLRALLVSQWCCGVICGPAGDTVMLWCHLGPAGVTVMLWCHLWPCWCHSDAVVSFVALLVSQGCCGVIWALLVSQ